MIILDISKAFDSVDQKLMISKLQDAGASSSCTEWFRSYFSGRQQVVRINSALSEPLPIVSGIPQGVHWHLCFLVYTAISRKAVGKNVHAAVTVLEGNMGYDQYTVPDTVGVEPSFVSVSFSTRKQASMVARAILSNFSEEQGTQNLLQHLSGMSCALCPTTFLEIRTISSLDLYQ